jgi:hypothetical protein
MLIVLVLCTTLTLISARQTVCPSSETTCMNGGYFDDDICSDWVGCDLPGKPFRFREHRLCGNEARQ